MNKAKCEKKINSCEGLSGGTQSQSWWRCVLLRGKGKGVYKVLVLKGLCEKSKGQQPHFPFPFPK